MGVVEMKTFVVIESEWESVDIKYCGVDQVEAE
jgi:hypothetical protein